MSAARRLAGNRSPMWAFMERFVIPNLDDPSETYLTRWRIVQTPWFAIFLHRMDGPDSRPTLHDHPCHMAAHANPREAYLRGVMEHRNQSGNAA